MSNEEKIELPEWAPKVGEQYRHFKGGLYRVHALAFNSTAAEWEVIYEPLYENPAAPFFARSVKEWNEVVERDGKTYNRFTKA